MIFPDLIFFVESFYFICLKWKKKKRNASIKNELNDLVVVVWQRESEIWQKTKHKKKEENFGRIIRFHYLQSSF